MSDPETWLWPDEASQDDGYATSGAAPMSETMTELKPHGYAPGHYMCKCSQCGEQFEGDKRAFTCLTCALPAALSAAEARGREAAAKWHDDEAEAFRKMAIKYQGTHLDNAAANALERHVMHEQSAAAIRKGLTP